MKPEHFLKFNEVCERLNVSASYLRRMIKDKQIPFYKFSREYRFKVKELEKWEKTKKVA